MLQKRNILVFSAEELKEMGATVSGGESFESNKRKRRGWMSVPEDGGVGDQKEDSFSARGSREFREMSGRLDEIVERTFDSLAEFTPNLPALTGRAMQALEDINRSAQEERFTQTSGDQESEEDYIIPITVEAEDKTEKFDIEEEEDKSAEHEESGNAQEEGAREEAEEGEETEQALDIEEVGVDEQIAKREEAEEGEETEQALDVEEVGVDEQIAKSEEAMDPAEAREYLDPGEASTLPEEYMNVFKAFSSSGEISDESPNVGSESPSTVRVNSFNSASVLPPVSADDQNSIPVPPPVSADDQNSVSVPPPVPADDRNSISVPPPVPADDRNSISVPPPVPADDRNSVPFPPPVPGDKQHEEKKSISSAEPSLQEEKPQPAVEMKEEDGGIPVPIPGLKTADQARSEEAGAAKKGEKKKTRKKKKSWFEDFFNDDYLLTLPFETSSVTAAEAEFIEKQLDLPRESRLLDLACGYGRHAVELAKKGYNLVGLDNSLPILLKAAEMGEQHGVEVNFMHGDMKEMTFEGEFQGVYCFNTSFGYFDDDTNKKVLEKVFNALNSGGRFLLEVVNRDFLLTDLPLRVWWEGEGCVVMEEVEFNYFTSRVESNRSVVFNDGRQIKRNLSIRVYSLHELGKLMHQAGFVVRGVTGNLETPGRFFGPHSPFLIIKSEKK